MSPLATAARCARRLAAGVFLAFALGLLASCGGSAEGGAALPPPADTGQSSHWNRLVWDRDNWN